MRERSNIDQARTATTPTIAPGQFSTNVLLSGAVRNRNPTNGTNHHTQNAACIDNLPWILLNGEQIMRKDESIILKHDLIVKLKGLIVIYLKMSQFTLK